ncbi:MAG: cyclic nucleotide-binding domain-containing protein, partial [Myxococcota bacterium]
KRIHLRRVPAGETILSDLDHSRQALFLIVNGSVDVLRRNEDGTRTYLAELSRGEFFGEFQLLTGRSRQALVRAANTVDLLVLDKDVITDLAEESPDIWKVLWDFYHARLLNNLLAGSSLFRSMSVRERDRIVHLFERLDVSEGQLVIRQGEFGVGIYLLLQGEMVVLAKEGHGGAPRMVTTLSSGDFFGTISALTDQPCAADVRATEVSILLFLKRDDLAKILQANPKVDEAFRTLVADRDVWVGQTGYSRFGIIKFTD